MPRKRKSKSAAIGESATKAKKAKKSPTKPATEEERALDFSRDVLRALKSDMAAIQKHPIGKTQLPPSRLAGFEKQISAASTQMTTHQLQKVSSKGSTAKESALRLALIDLVTTVRDAVSNVADVEDATARAFGRGARLSRAMNADVLLVSSQQQQAFGKANYAAAAEKAGVSAQLITAIMVARRALSTAASAGASATKKGVGLDKKAMIKALTKETNALRNVAKIVFKGKPAKLASYGPARKKPGATSGPSAEAEVKREAKAQAEANAAKKEEAALRAKADAKAKTAAATAAKAEAAAEALNGPSNTPKV